ncbi:hypothetical protein [Defluviitalea saccharophila]|uniref:Uncharacterized protein n=1 Tax=Defluviitalea saccharophila TaxID=879970 RepID=A0ABZ2Y5J8_9FIRM
MNVENIIFDFLHKNVFTKIDFITFKNNFQSIFSSMGYEMTQFEIELYNKLIKMEEEKLHI